MEVLNFGTKVRLVNQVNPEDNNCKALVVEYSKVLDRYGVLRLRKIDKDGFTFSRPVGWFEKNELQIGWAKRKAKEVLK